MFRPMTSDVSALSGVVAKGHQAMHFVSSTPSKIPYGGFSPVRLQTHFTPRPPSHVLLLLLIGRHWRLLYPRRWFRIGTCVQAAPRISNPHRESSGPWLPFRFYCPAGSLLTMATSAPLRVAQWFIHYPIELRVRPANLRGSPIYSANPLTPCRCPYSGDSNNCI